MELKAEDANGLVISKVKPKKKKCICNEGPEAKKKKDLLSNKWDIFIKKTNGTLNWKSSDEGLIKFPWK